MKKTYVQVDSVRSKRGWLIPTRICMPDGECWDVENVLYASVSYDGEYEGIRYIVTINKGQEYLYRTGQTWYVMT